MAQSVSIHVHVISLWDAHINTKYVWFSLFSLAIDVFAFDVYDSDGDGKLTIDQAQKMFREMFGQKATLENEAVKA